MTDIAVDQASLGTPATAGAFPSISLVTSVAVATGGYVLVHVGWFGTQTVTGATVAGNTATVLVQGANGSTHSCLIGYYASGGLSSGVTITATMSAAGTQDGVIGAMSLVNTDSTTPVSSTTGPTGVSTAAWATPSATLAAGGAFVASARKEGFAPASNTPASGVSESFDVSFNDNGNVLAYRIEAAGGSFTVGGTWNAADPNVNVGAVIAPAAGGGGAAAVDAWNPLRPGFMTGTAFPSFMDAPNITGWSPFGTAYDLGTGGPQAYTSPLSGTVGFTGADAVRTSKGLTAATVGFTGSLTKRLARSLAATVSFTGAHATAAVHNFTQALTATLSFTGAQSRRVGKGIAATVSFTGAQSRATAASKSATVSFTGAQTRRVSSGLSATVSFTGAQTRRVGHGMTATLSFTGAHATAAVHFFTQTFTATVGFTGSLATAAVHVFTKALTATVGFTGSVTRRTARSVSATVGLTAGALTRRIGSGQSATVGFTGSIRRAIGRRLSAAIGFVGNLLGQGSGAATTDPNPQTASFTEHATATFIERNTDTFIEHATATSRSNR